MSEITKEAVPEFSVGYGTIDGTPTALQPNKEVLKYVVIRADVNNTGEIRIGVNAAGTANGFPLKAGEQSPMIHIDNLSKVWIVGSTTGQVYSWIAV